MKRKYSLDFISEQLELQKENDPFILYDKYHTINAITSLTGYHPVVAYRVLKELEEVYDYQTYTNNDLSQVVHILMKIFENNTFIHSTEYKTLQRRLYTHPIEKFNTWLKKYYKKRLRKLNNVSNIYLDYIKKYVDEIQEDEEDSDENNSKYVLDLQI